MVLNFLLNTKSQFADFLSLKPKLSIKLLVFNKTFSPTNFFKFNITNDLKLARNSSNVLYSTI